jgi:predicted Fe-Mo cluster-binding NifX family protein
MKLAIPAEEGKLDAPLAGSFGRAPLFVIYDTDTGDYEALENAQNLQAAQGAGIQAAQNIARSGAAALLTGNCGPKAFSVLQSANIEVFTGCSGTVQDAIDAHKAGALDTAAGPNVQGHWQ